MRIGLFTDTYRPSINGIVFVVESLKRELEALGHEVYVFCPAKALLPGRMSDDNGDDERIIRFPSLKGAFFDDYDTSIFFPPRVVQQIKDLHLDVIHTFTPSQVGLIGVRAAVKCDIPFIMQHSTDLYEFSADYPAVLPGILMLATIIAPASVKMGPKDIYEMMKLYRPRLGATAWNQDIIKKAVTVIYSKADAVIALSRKSVKQLESWQDEDYSYDVTLLPNGVDALPTPTPEDIAVFRAQYGIAAEDEVFGFVGRLAKEKNLDVLISALERVLAERPRARLLFVGDFEYRETLEEKAEESGYGDRITFTGALPRASLGVVYEVLDVFVFPSLKDTQGWVLHEAAHAGTPIVLVDRDLSEVFEDGVSGYYAENNAEDIAKKIMTILGDTALRERMSAASRQLAATFTECEQVAKLEQLYEVLVGAESDEN